MSYTLNITTKCRADIIDDIIKTGEHPECDKLEKYRKQGKVNKNGMLLVEQKYTLKNERAYPEKKLTLMSFSNELRKLISVKCIDIDIKKCLPSCVKYYANKYKIKTPTIDDYLANTQSWFDEKITKKDINIVLNTVDATGFLSEKNNLKLNQLHTEVQFIIQTLSLLPDFKSAIKYAKTKTNNIKPNNFLFYMCAPLELEIIHTITEYINTQTNCHINEYTFDGLLIQTTPDTNPETLLAEINKKVEGIVEFARKPFNEDTIYTFSNQTSQTQETDERPWDIVLCEKLLEHFKDQIFKVNGKIMLYDNKSGLWTNDEVEHRRIFMDNQQLFELPKEQAFLGIYKNIYPLIQANAPVNDEFYNDEAIGHLLFTNGVLDMKEYKMLPVDAKYRFTKIINRPYRPRELPTEDLIEKLFETMIIDEEKRNYLLELIARAVAGEYPDRQFCALIGNTACGKGVITKLLQNTLGQFTATFNTDNLLKRAGNMRYDPERENAPVVKFHDCRITIGNEFSILQDTQGKNMKIDGKKIKSWVSGGDVIHARDVGDKSIPVVNKSFLFLLCNDILDVDNAEDAYISRANYICADRSSRADITEPDELFFPAIDPKELNDYINDINTMDAFIALMCDYYAISVNEGRMDKPDCVKHTTSEFVGEKNTPVNWIEANYEVVSIQPDWFDGESPVWENIGNNFIAVADLYEHYKRDGNAMSETKFGKSLNEISKSVIKKINKKVVRVRVGIKRSNETEELEF